MSRRSARLAAVLAVAAAVLPAGCRDGGTAREASGRQAGERELSAVTVPAGWSASTVDYLAAGMQQRYARWRVDYRGLDVDERAARTSYTDALRTAGWHECGTGAGRNDLVPGELCKPPYQIALSSRRGPCVSQGALPQCTDLTVTLYRVD